MKEVFCLEIQASELSNEHNVNQLFKFTEKYCRLPLVILSGAWYPKQHAVVSHLSSVANRYPPI